MSFSIMHLERMVFTRMFKDIIGFFQLESLKWWVMSLVASILPDFSILSNISVVLAFSVEGTVL